MSILSQLNNEEEKIIGGYPMNGNISSIDKYNYNDTVNILEDTDYNVSFELNNKKNIKNKCLCINNNNNKLSIDNCGTDNCKFKIKSEIDGDNYNDTNESIRGESNEGIVINLTYNNESSDKRGNNMLNLTNYSSSTDDDIILELVNPGIKCYDENNQLKKDYSKGLTDATLNDVYRNNSTCKHIYLYCYLSIIKDDGIKYYLKKKNNDILIEKKGKSKWILKFINTKSKFNKCYILFYSEGSEGNEKYLSKTHHNSLQLTSHENKATLFNFRVKKDIDNYKFLFVNHESDTNNNLISLRSYNNENDDTHKLYNLKFNLNVEKNGKSEKKQIKIEDTILIDEKGKFDITNEELLDSTLLSKKLEDVEIDIVSRYNNNYEFLVDYATFRNNLDELKTVARYYRNLLININNIEKKLLLPFTININQFIKGQSANVRVITNLYKTCIELKKNYENFKSNKYTPKNNNTFLKSLSIAIIDENKIDFLLGNNEFNDIGLLQFVTFFIDKDPITYYKKLLYVYLLNFESADIDNLGKEFKILGEEFKNNQIYLNLELYINNKNFLGTNIKQLNSFNTYFQDFEYKTKNFDFLKDNNIYDYCIHHINNINNLINNVTVYSYKNITTLYDNFDSIKSKINKINDINFAFSIGGINDLRVFYNEVYKNLDKFGIEFIGSALSDDNVLYTIMNDIFNSQGEPVQSGDYINIKRVEYFVKLYSNINRYKKNDIINTKRKNLIKNLSFKDYTNIDELKNGIFRIYYFKVLNKFLNDIYTNNKDAISHLSASIQDETISYSIDSAGPASILQKDSFKNREGFEIPNPKNFLKENNTLKNILNKNKMIYYTNIDGNRIQVDDIEDYTNLAFINNQKLINSTTWSGDYSNDSTYQCAVDNSEHKFLVNYKYKCLDNTKDTLSSQPVSLNYNSFELGDCTKSDKDLCSFKYNCKLIIENDKVFLKLFDEGGGDVVNLDKLELISLEHNKITKNDLENFNDCLNLSQITSFKNDNVINTTISSDYDDDETSDEINSLCSVNDIINTSINSIDKLRLLYDKNIKSSSKHLYLTTDSNDMCLIIRNGKFKLIYVTKKKKEIKNDGLRRISGEQEYSSQIIDNVNYGDTGSNEFYLYKNPNYTSNDNEKIANNISKFGYVDIKGKFHKLEDDLIDKNSTFYDISDTRYCLDEKYVNPGYAHCDDQESCLGRLSIDNNCGSGTGGKCYMIDDIKNLYISHTGECVTDNTGEAKSGKFEQKRYSIKRDSSDINSYSHITNSEKTHTITNTKYLELMNNYLSSDNFDTSSFLNNISNSVKVKYDTLRKENNNILKNLIESYNELSEEEMNIINKSTEMKEDLQKNILENYKKNIVNIDKVNKYINLEEGRENQYRNLKRESDYKLAVMGILSITSVIMLLHYTKK
tara:strand:+ start:4249 stop:8457 length:4209 start_codon:yes stop_codon:yes gene_type:complete